MPFGGAGQSAAICEKEFEEVITFGVVTTPHGYEFAEDRIAKLDTDNEKSEDEKEQIKKEIK